MSELNHERVTNLFAEATALPAARRGAFLDSTCAGEPALRRELEELLACADTASDAFDAAAQEIVHAPDPQQIGPYEILEPIGEGGMAVVYKARQHHPVRRIVALKLIKLGMDTRQFVARFESERQALALMDHPNVARVYDAGATDTGRPYFVMEYVPGSGILEYCDEHKLGIRQRLELFIVVCDAVEHAHRKGIIHRDIKDSNVLVSEVDGNPVPKVIDFGVAKAISQRLTDRTMFTEQGQLIGTPEYMSPEQAERGTIDIDTRSDVYSLGVLLYELIAGVQPIPSEVLRSAGYEQVQRIIRETEPPRPSTRLSTLGGADATRIAQRRQIALPTLIRDLRSELEWIPLKAIRKDREQRYRSAAELADDIANYLTHRPLLAGPESGWYRTKKFLHRHKFGVAASAAMAFLLLGGIVTTTWQAIRASQERDNAQATLDFLTNDVISGATPENIPDARVRDQIINAMIAPAAQRVGVQFKDRPLTEASVRESISKVLRTIGRSDLALPQAEAALAIRRGLLGEDHPETLRSLNSCATALEEVGRFVEAEAGFKQVLERRRRLLGDDDPGTLISLSNYAGVLQSLGRSAEAERLYAQALAAYRRAFGDDNPETIVALNNHAAALRALDRVAEAEPLYKEALDRNRHLLGDDHPATMTSVNNYAYVLKLLNRRDEAGALVKECFERRRRVLGEDHPESIWSSCEYAQVLHSQGRLDEAERMFRDALDRNTRVMGPDHFRSIKILNNYAAILVQSGRLAEAEPLFKDALERRRRAVGEDHPDMLNSLNNYAAVLRALHRAEEAEPLARRAVAAATTNPSMGPKHRDTRAFANNHAKVLEDLGRPAEAAAIRRQFGLSDPATRASTRPGTLPQ